MVFGGHQLNRMQGTGRGPQALARLFLLFSWIGVHLAQSASGQPIPLGSDFQVNTITTDSQIGADVTAVSDHFVVVWQGAEQVSGVTRRNIQMRRLDATGQFASDDFKVNTYPVDQSFQTRPKIAATSTGGFVVAWQVSDLGSSASDIRGRRFLNDGVPIGADFRVNASTAFIVEKPDVAAASDGRFLVVWERDPVSGQAAIDGRIFLSDGTPVTGDFVISTYMTGFDILPAVAATPNGDFIVTWAGADGNDRGIKTRRVSPDGMLLSQEFVVNTVTTGPQSIPKLAVNSTGEALVVWEAGVITIPQQPGSLNVWARRLDVMGAPVATEFRVPQTPGYDNLEPAVGFDTEDNALIVWQAVPLAPATAVIGGQILSAGDVLLPVDVVINSYTETSPLLAAVATLPDGTMLVTWDGIPSPGDDTSSDAVIGRLFQGLIPALAPVAPIPTLGHLGLIAFALLLALAALRVVRR